MRILALVALILLLGATAASGDGHLFVASWDNDRVLRYDEATGDFVDTFVPNRSGGLNQPFGIVIGPHDHALYVTSGEFQGPGQTKAVLRFDGTTGAFLGALPGSAHLTSPRGLVFGPDGNLYVGDGDGPGAVLRFHAQTGEFMDEFVARGSGGMLNPQGIVFGPDGDLYVASAKTHSIERHDGATGVSLGSFVPTGREGLTVPGAVVFSPTGDLIVVSFAHHFYPGLQAVLRFQGPGGSSPGAFIDVFIPPDDDPSSTPWGAIFGPDRNHDGFQDLYVGSFDNTGGKANFKSSRITAYDGLNGDFIEVFVEPGNGLDGPNLFVFSETDPVTLEYTGP